MSETNAETTSSAPASAPDCANCPAAAASESTPSKDGGGGRGERQKVVTERYRSNWDSIFSKKSR